MIKKLKFKNNTEIKMKVYLEPWAEEYVLPPGSIIIFYSKDISKELIEVEYAVNSITVYGWDDEITVEIDNKKALPDFR